MELSHQLLDRPLDFLKIWHNVFSNKIEYSVLYGEYDPSLSPGTVSNDQVCQMGEWLFSQPENIRGLDNYRHLIDIHRCFHVKAGEVVSLQREGLLEEASIMVGGAFAEVSDGVSRAIDALSHELVDMGIYTERFPQPVNSNSSIWDPSFVIGIAEVDRQHHAIATLIDQVLVNGDITSASSEANRFLAALARMIERDIDAERPHLDLLNGTNPARLAHLEAHESIRVYLADLREAIDRHEAISFAKVGRYLANWYIDHLVAHDLDIEVNWAGKSETC